MEKPLEADITIVCPGNSWRRNTRFAHGHFLFISGRFSVSSRLKIHISVAELTPSPRAHIRFNLFPLRFESRRPEEAGGGSETVTEPKEETALNKSSGTRYPAGRSSRKHGCL